ncbi:MAG: hypothetical protein ACE5J3_11955, partial [Methanosarcinales archaeon]
RLIDFIIENADKDWIEKFVFDVVEVDWGSWLKYYDNNILGKWAIEVAPLDKKTAKKIADIIGKERLEEIAKYGEIPYRIGASILLKKLRRVVFQEAVAGKEDKWVSKLEEVITS